MKCEIAFMGICDVYIRVKETEWTIKMDWD